MNTPKRKKILLQLPGINLTNVLCPAFSYVSCACTFLCLHFRFVLYWRKTVGAKAAHRTYVKLTPGIHNCSLNNIEILDLVVHSEFSDLFVLQSARIKVNKKSQYITTENLGLSN